MRHLIFVTVRTKARSSKKLVPSEKERVLSRSFTVCPAFFLAFLHKRNGVPSVETAPKGILQEYEGILQECAA